MERNTLKVMMARQFATLDQFILIENLPQYPVDLNTKAGQAIIKKFTGRFIEELSESYSELENALSNAQINNIEEAKQCVVRYNVEVADAWHFLLEIIIYSGYDVYNIDGMLHKYISNNSGHLSNFYKENSPVETLLILGKYFNDHNALITYPPGLFRIFTPGDLQLNPSCYGGNNLNMEALKTHAYLLWEVTHTLNKLTNLLKNRAWKNSEPELNALGFEDGLTEVLLVWGAYLNYAGFTEQSILLAYKEKNDVVNERIKNGY